MVSESANSCKRAGYRHRGCTIRVILANHSSHLPQETRAYLATRPNRFKYVPTPTHGSWLNIGLLGIAEINAMPVAHRWKAFQVLEAAEETA